MGTPGRHTTGTAPIGVRPGMSHGAIGEFVLPSSLHPLTGKIALPGSKSVTHRAYIAAALARGKSRISGDLLCDDTQITRKALESMGAVFQKVPDGIDVLGFGTSPRSPREVIYLGQSGTSLRLLMSLALLTPSSMAFSGEKRLLERPIQPLLEALQSLGANIVCRQSGELIEVGRGSGLGGAIDISGNISSQFISSLLIVGPLLEKGLQLRIVPPIVSRPYIDLTIDVMQHFGITVEETPDGFAVEGGQTYRPREFRVEADLSTASYFWAAAAISGGTIVTPGVPKETCQCELAFLELLERMGCRVTRTDSSVTVHGQELRGIDADLRHIPDQVPTLAVLGALAQGPTRISGVRHLRWKESDRLACLQQELEKLGIKIQETEDGLTIASGPIDQGNVLLDSHSDHRLAMSFALLGLRSAQIRLRDPECVSKSFPNFWTTWTNLVNGISSDKWGE